MRPLKFYNHFHYFEYKADINYKIEQHYITELKFTSNGYRNRFDIELE